MAARARRLEQKTCRATLLAGEKNTCWHSAVLHFGTWGCSIHVSQSWLHDTGRTIILFEGRLRRLALVPLFMQLRDHCDLLFHQGELPANALTSVTKIAWNSNQTEHDRPRCADRWQKEGTQTCVSGHASLRTASIMKHLKIESELRG